MTETCVRRRMGRSICALLAALVAGVILSIGTDIALHAAGIFPALGQPMSNGLLLLATGYRAVYSIAASYVAARLAPDRPMAHALALGVVGLLASLAGALATWNMGSAFGSHWYALVLVALAMPCAWLGGVMHRISR